MRDHDAVVLTIPFTVLRGVDLDTNLGLSPRKRNAIDALGYGTNAKMMVGFGPAVGGARAATARRTRICRTIS